MNTEWLNENRYRAYPFVEDSNFALVPSNPSIPTNRPYILPNWALVDISVIDLAHYTLDTVGFYLLRVTVKSDSIDLHFNITGGLTQQYAFTVTAQRLQDESEEGHYSRVSGAIEKAGMLSGMTHFRAVTGYGTTDLPEGEYETENRPRILQTRCLVFPDYGLHKLSAGGVTAHNIVTVGPGRYTDMRVINNRLYLYAGFGEGSKPNIVRSENDCGNRFLFFNGQTADNTGNIRVVGGAGIDVVSDNKKSVVTINNTPHLVPGITIKASPTLEAFMNEMSQS